MENKINVELSYDEVLLISKLVENNIHLTTSSDLETFLLGTLERFWIGGKETEKFVETIGNLRKLYSGSVNLEEVERHRLMYIDLNKKLNKESLKVLNEINKRINSETS